MSWHIKNCGTKAEVTAAIDEAVAANQGMPKSVGDYLKEAVAHVDLSDGSGGPDRYAVVVESTGHRPLQGSGSEEKCVVTKLRRGTWTPPGAS